MIIQKLCLIFQKILRIIAKQFNSGTHIFSYRGTGEQYMQHFQRIHRKKKMVLFLALLVMFFERFSHFYGYVLEKKTLSLLGFLPLLDFDHVRTATNLPIAEVESKKTSTTRTVLSKYLSTTSVN